MKDDEITDLDDSGRVLLMLVDHGPELAELVGQDKCPGEEGPQEHVPGVQPEVLHEELLVLLGVRPDNLAAALR